MRKIILSFALIISGLCISFAYVSPGIATGHVNDFAGVISPQTKQALSERLSSFTASTTHEMVVVVIKTVGTDETIETYATKLFEEWKIGKKGVDNGVLFLVAIDDHKARIEVGYGLEGVLPDTISNNILKKEVLPLFKDGKYDEGIIAGTVAVERVIQNEPGAKEGYTAPSGRGFSSNMVESALVFAVFIFGVLGNILASSKRWWPGGIGGAVIGFGIGFFFFTLIGGIISGIVLGFVGLLLDYFLSQHGPFKGFGGGRPFALGGFGGRGGGSSFGGFGGGRSGGGGSSGSW